MAAESAIEWIKGLWPIALVIGGHVVRTELTGRSNKQAIATLEEKRKEDKLNLSNQRKEDHERMDRFEKTIEATMREVRDDIKTLLSR